MPSFVSLHRGSGWIAAVMFFRQNTGSAVVMLFSAVLFTLVALLMVLILIRVSPGSLQQHTQTQELDHVLACSHSVGDTNISVCGNTSDKKKLLMSHLLYFLTPLNGALCPTKAIKHAPQ